MDLSAALSEFEGVEGTEAIDTTETQEKKVETTSKQKISIKCISIGDWFNKNEVSDVKPINLKILGVNNETTKLFASETGEILEGNIPERTLILIERADAYLVPDLVVEGFSFNGTNSEMTCKFSSNVYLKIYNGKKTKNLFVCEKIDGRLVPFKEFKEDAETFDLCYESNIDDMKKRLNEPLNKDIAIMLYKQVKREVETMQTNSDFVSWLFDRSLKIRDNNHHIQIYEAMINILGY